MGGEGKGRGREGRDGKGPTATGEMEGKGRRGEVKGKRERKGKGREGGEGKSSPWCPQPLTPSAAMSISSIQYAREQSPIGRPERT